MHTSQLPSGAWARHDSDFSGPVKLITSITNVEVGLGDGKDLVEVEIEVNDLKALVAEWMRDRMVSRLEQATDDEILEMN